jgi:hypothetical protein
MPVQQLKALCYYHSLFSTLAVITAIANIYLLNSFQTLHLFDIHSNDRKTGIHLSSRSSAFYIQALTGLAHEC